MRCQLLIADGNRQVILYPEDEDEKGVLKCLTGKEYDITIHMADTNIQTCHGGWYRNHGSDKNYGLEGDQAVITLMRKKPQEETNDTRPTA